MDKSEGKARIGKIRQSTRISGSTFLLNMAVAPLKKLVIFPVCFMRLVLQLGDAPDFGGETPHIALSKYPMVISAFSLVISQDLQHPTLHPISKTHHE
jgi:hypothetical protein